MTVQPSRHFQYQESEWEHMVEVSRWVWRLKTFAASHFFGGFQPTLGSEDSMGFFLSDKWIRDVVLCFDHGFIAFFGGGGFFLILNKSWYKKNRWKSKLIRNLGYLSYIGGEQLGSYI